MIRFEDALKIVLENVKPLDTGRIRTLSALGYVLAQDIYSTLDLPSFDNSAIDGYALKSSDTQDVSKNNSKILEVIDDLPAGHVSTKRLKSGEGIRIMTGAPIPAGADAVIMVEDTKIVDSLQLTDHRKKCGQRSMDYGKIEIFRKVKEGENIRRKGEDVKKGELVISKGKVICPAEIGMLASLNIQEVNVIKHPRVAILATGDELIDIGQDLEPGKVRNNNSYVLFTQVIKYGGIPVDLGVARDKKNEIGEKVVQGLSADILLISGGVSVGDYDLVKDVLIDLGMKMKFWKVAMKPGKPFVFGLIEGKPIFGLPGNPVSSMVTFEQFVRPAILKMRGITDLSRTLIKAIIKEEIKKKIGLRYFIPAIVKKENNQYFVTTTGPQGSGILKSMILSNGLIILPEEVTHAEVGEEVTVELFD
ncbi:MAG: gephyrin-like molybdotransferase Glp [bacterium]